MSQQKKQLWAKADKQLKTKYTLGLILFLTYVAILVGLLVWLAIAYHDSYDYVAEHFAPGKEFADKAAPDWYWKDLIAIFGGNETAPTYGQIYVERGQEGFAWFYLTSGFPSAIVPYVLLPVFSVLSFAGAIFWIFQYRSIFPPVKKPKKAKKAKKANAALSQPMEGGNYVIS